MLLGPKRWKFRKQHVPALKGKSTRGNVVSFGQFGLKATTSGYVSSKQLEASRKVVVRHIKKVGKLWFRVFPDVPFTKKGLEMPMGKGKGDVDIYKAAIRKGKVIFEVTGLTKEEAGVILESAGKKLPIRTKMIVKGEIN